MRIEIFGSHSVSSQRTGEIISSEDRRLPRGGGRSGADRYSAVPGERTDRILRYRRATLVLCVRGLGGSDGRWSVDPLVVSTGSRRAVAQRLDGYPELRTERLDDVLAGSRTR